jgi:hypothetical protein
MKEVGYKPMGWKKERWITKVIKARKRSRASMRRNERNAFVLQSGISLFANPLTPTLLTIYSTLLISIAFSPASFEWTECTRKYILELFYDMSFCWSLAIFSAFYFSAALVFLLWHLHFVSIIIKYFALNYNNLLEYMELLNIHQIINYIYYLSIV